MDGSTTRDLRADIVEMSARARELGVEIDPSAQRRIARYAEVLGVWNRRWRLTGERDPRTIVRKHVLDCAMPARWLPPQGLVVDIGSGAGLPGLILATLRPDLDVALIESRRHACSFLREAARMLALPRVAVRNARAEDVANDPELAGKAAFVISRAVRLGAFLPLAVPFLSAEGVVVAMRGAAGGEDPRAIADAGLRIADVFEYVLADGEARRLVLLAR